MALEWAALAYLVGAEAIIVLVVTMPGIGRLRKGMIAISRSSLQPLMAIVPFCFFLLLDIYWKFEHLPKCEGPTCSIAEQIRHDKSILKSQRNALLVAAALLLYWLLYRATHMLVDLEKLHQQVKQLKSKSSD